MSRVRKQFRGPLLLALAGSFAAGCGGADGDDGATSVDAATIDAPTTPDAGADGGSSLLEARGIVHVHSPFSHDACDGLGLTDGVPNAVCRQQLREALCETHLDFAMLTDHPNFMRDYPFEELLLHEAASDEFIRVDDQVVGNRISCEDGHQVFLTVGYETTPHTMPLGLERHLAPEHYAGLSDSMTTEESQTLVSALSAAGAVTAIAHSEEENISAAFIVESGLDAMEWYNVHGNFKELLGGDAISGSASEIGDILDTIGRFADESSGAHPDLVNLFLLQTLPEAGLDKWREVIRSRNITGLLGSDVHQNVTVDAICDESNPLNQLACIAAAEAILPDYLHFIITGGNLRLSDGGRIDSYPRVMRWLHNRVLVETKSIDEIKRALKEGRSYGVFSVLGQPEGFLFQGKKDGLVEAEIGGTASGPIDLTVKIPALTSTEGGASFDSSQAASAVIRTRIFHSTAAGTSLVHEATGTEGITFPVSEAGAYHVEVWITPNHLTAALGTEAALANHEYMWIISNPIRL